MKISTNKFQEIMGQLQALDVRVYEQLNEDNPKEAKQEFLTHEEMVYPAFKHDVAKIERLVYQADVLVREIRPLIAEPDCSETQKRILTALWQQIFAAHQHVLRVLLDQSDLDLLKPMQTRFMKDDVKNLRTNVDLMEPVRTDWPHLLQVRDVEKLRVRDLTAEKRQLERLSQQYYGYRIDKDLIWALLHDWLELMTDNMDDWAADNPNGITDNWNADDRQYLEEIRVLLATHGLDKVWERDASKTVLIYHPDEDVVERFGRLAQRKLAPILEKLPEQPADQSEVYSADALVEMLNEFFAAQFGDRSKFHAVKDEKGTVMSVNQAKREVLIPEHRSKGPIDWFTLYTKVAGHEIGTHVWRGVPYEQTELPMLSTGFLVYEGQEEGIATCTEKALAQVIGQSDAFDHSPIEYLVGIGLASQYGFNFRELYTLERDILYLQTVKHDSDRETVMQKAIDNAYSKVRRVFRGTGDVVDFKDQVYYLEEVETWGFITGHIDCPDELWATLKTLGKANIRDSETRGILRAVVESDDFPLAKAQLLSEKVLPFALPRVSAD